MIYTLRILGQVLLWVYIIVLISWWGLHQIFGDGIWWLGLVNSFVPLLFLPLSIFLPLAFLIRQPLYSSGLLLPLTLFLVNYGSLFLPQTAPIHVTSEPPLSIMTFNMWSGSRSIETINVISENGLPDIVALQETTYRLNQMIRRKLGDRYPYQLYEQTINGRGISILSRFPLTTLRSDLIIDLNCRIYRVTVDATRQFRLYNCHPRSSNIVGFMGDGFPMGAQVEETFRMRRQLSLALAKEITTHNEPAIVVGDFNTTDQSEAYAILHQTLIDAHRAAGSGFGHTFPAYGGSYREIPIIPRLVRIDMIWHTDAFVTLESHVGKQSGESDHLPVLATLAWRK